MQGRLLFLLLFAVVAGLAEGLEIVRVEEQPLIAPMRLLVIADQLGGVAFDPAACRHLTGVEITQEGGLP